MKSPYQIAKELKVSPQAVYQKIDRIKEQLLPYIQHKENKMLIDEEGETLLKSTFSSIEQDVEQDRQAVEQPIEQPIEQDVEQDRQAIEQAVEQDRQAVEQAIEQAVEQALLNTLNKHNTEIEYLREEIDLLKQEVEQYKKDLEHERDQNKLLQDELKIEREHSRQQADRTTDLAERLAKLNENQQVLLLSEQNKHAPLLSEARENNEEQNDKKNKGFFGLFKVKKNKQ
jgi:chromosome segregation ATPase